jgi:hypothetical protein
MRRALLALLLALSGTAHAGPGIVGNGGDSVRCEPNASVSAFKGLYSLDYLLTYQTRNDNADVADVFSWEESRDRIAAILAAKSPDLAFGFSSFVADMDNSFDYTRPHIWREAGFGLVNLNDERLIRKIPANCYKLHDDQSIDVIQTVVQTQRADLAIFEYDPSVYDEFLHLAPLQFSFLMVHEWLWSFTDDVRVVREVDRFLHSKAAEQLAPDAFATALNNMGLMLRATDFVPVCDRSQAVRDALQQFFGKSCGEITAAMLQRDARPELLHLSTVPTPLAAFKLGDFSGFEAVDEMHLSGHRLQHVYEHQFDGVPGLDVLDLSDNALTAFPDNVLRSHPRVHTLSLAKNELTEIPRSVFLDHPDPGGGAERFMISYVDLSHNRIAAMPDLRSLPDADRVFAIDELNLSGNELRAVSPDICRFLNYFNDNGSFGRVGKLILTGNPLSAAAVAALQNAPACLGTTKIVF